MNNNTYLIEKSDIEQAQEISRFIDNTESRNRATANVLAVQIASKLFDSNTHEINITSGLHNLAFILDKYNIADIYVNGTYIDVRIAFNENELAIPSFHFNNNILPAAYMFLKLSEDLDNAEVLGFVMPEDVKTTSNDEYINIDPSVLKSFYDIEPLLRKEDDLDEVEDKQIFDFIDGKCTDEISFLAEIIKTERGREKLIKAYKAQIIFNYISKTSGTIATEESSSIESSVELQESPVLDLDSNVEDSLDSFEIQEDFMVEESLDEVSELNEDSSLDEISDLNTFDSDELESFENTDSDGLFTEEAGFENNEIMELSPYDEITEEPEAQEAEINSVELDINDLESSLGESSSIENFIEEEEEEETAIDDFSTVTTPSFNFDEELVPTNNNEQDDEQEDDVIEEIAEEEQETLLEENLGSGFDVTDLDNDDAIEDFSEIGASVETEDVIENIEPANNSEEEIQTLFNTSQDEEITMPVGNKQKKSIGVLPIAALAVALIGGGIYWGYNKFTAQEDISTNNIPREIEKSVEPINSIEDAQPIAMPVETVDNATVVLNTEEGTSETIPAIEQNLDASILVSNLKVDWEVPSGYASNTAAKRYLLKLGKIIQFNLKTELLLLNKPPISNKIAVEIQYNETSGRFEAVGIKTSSGENEVDKLIMNVINNALAMNLNMNTDSFKNLNAHPVLIIKL